jgi:hypothetical protein
MSSAAQLAVPEDGQVFSSFEDVRTAVLNWAVRDKFAALAARSDTTRRVFCCASAKQTSCPWRVTAYVGVDRQIRLSIKCDEHTCLGAGTFQRGASSRREWLDNTVV